MLIYVQLFGGVVQKTLPVDIKAECTIGELQKRILTLNPGISIKRCIFAGKQLDDQNKTIAQYDVYKESTIQVFSAKVLSAEELAEQEAAAAAEEKEKSDADAKPAAAAAGARDGEEKEDGGAAASVSIKIDPAAPLSSPSGGATSVPASDDLPPLASRPFMVRQPTNEDLQYGDVLVVKLIQARNLMAVDWNGTSDPYAIVAVDKQSAKSSMIKKKLNPIWNETFFFHLDLSGTTPSAAAQHSAGKVLEDVAAAGLSVPMSPTRATSESVDLSSSSSSSSSSIFGGGKKSKKGKMPLPSRNLSVMLFDHDWVRHDETLGWFEVDLNSVPRDRYVERTFRLNGVKNGEVSLSLQRCTLTSPQMQRILKTLVALGRPIKQADLAAKSVSLRQLLGKEPYISLPAKDGAESGGASSSRRSKNNSSDLSGTSSSAAAAAASFAAVANFGGHSIQFIPALSHLAALIVDPRSRFSTNNQRTLAKVLYILKSQQVVDLTSDLPTRVLWFSNLSGGSGDEALSPSNLFITLRKHFPNRIKRMLIPKSSRQGCVYVTFKRVEDAILALLTMLDLRPLRACFGQPFEPAQAQLLFSALKAGILQMAGPFPNPLGTAPGQALESVAAAASEGMSDDLPPANLLAPPGPIGGVARAISMARENSLCNNFAPNQKGKAELEWNGYWMFISAPEYALGRPAVLYALANTSDFNTRNPSDSKWFFRIELTPARCVIVRSGAWSIEIIDRTPLPGEEEAAAKEEPIGDDDEEEKSNSAPPQRVKESLSPAGATRNQRTYFIRAHSTPVVDEWFALLKALRSGETIMSPRKPGSFAAQLNAASAAAASAKSSPSASPPALGSSNGAPAASMQPDALALSGSLVPMSPVAQSYLEEINTRVFCTTCKSIKSILDIYTLDAALDVTPTHPDAGMGAAASSSSASTKPYIDPALQHMQLPISPPSSGRGSPSFPGSSAPPRVIQFTITACVDCLKSSIQTALAKKDFEALTAGFSVQDLSDLLPRDQFEQFLDQSVSHVVDSNPKRFTRCPKCQCPLEMDHHTWSTKSESFLVGMLGLDKQPMDEAAKAFFLANRFLCRACRTDFCRACKAFPFHPGYSCKEYGEYLVAPKCRFCAAVVTAKTKYQAPDGVQASLAFTGSHPVCNSAECREKVEQACGMMLKCGHPCAGAASELDHPPCMYPECEDRDLKAETREDTCSICYTEELGQAPIVKLTCGHIFHLACVRQRLQTKWSSTRIAFEFMNCSLCNAKMQHVLLTDLLRPLYHLENQVKAMSLQRLEFEALTDHTDIVTPGGRFYQDPSGFAMNFFMFYQCYDCQEPYFAGQRACGAAGVEEEVKREDLICGGCQKVPSFDECPTHGSSFLIFKCRFCCNFSTFFCFGKTHFCDACHSGSVWPQLVTSAGVNLKTYDQYTQCAGIKDKVLAVLAKYPDKAEQDQILSHTYCDPAQCPIGCRHLPAGFEWGAGCGMCKPSDQKNTEADKLKREEDAKMKLLLREGAKEIRRWKVSDEGIVFKAADSLADGAKIEEAKHEEPAAPAPVAAAPAPSLSLHAEADVPAGSILGLSPPAPAGAPRSAQVVRGASASKLDVVIRHNLTPDGDDLELQQVDAEGSIVPPSIDRGSGGLAAESLSDTWFHFSSKRALAYGCHYFQFKIASMPASIYPADPTDLWSSAQMLFGIVEEDAEVPLSSVQTPGKPLDLYAAKHPAFANNGCKVDAATGSLSAPLPSASWRAGDVISLLVDLDQPGGVQMTLYKNGFEHSTREHGFTNLKLHPKHTHVKLIASFRGGAGFLVSLSDLNFIDRAQYRFECDNALAPEARLPRGSSLIPMMANQNAQTHKLRWMPLVTRHMEGEVIDLPAAGEIDDLIAEGDEDEEGKDADNPDDEEWLDQGEGHHDPATITLATRCPQMRILGLEATYAPGGHGQVITLQATAGLPIWGMSEKQYYEITVLDRGRGCTIGMGNRDTLQRIAQAGYPIDRMPGWNRPSYAYHGDDGKKFVGPQSSGALYGPVWKVGDVVGMCIDRKSREIFYTLNGNKLAVAFRDVDINAKWLPTIGMHSEGEKVRVNFSGPFRWSGLNAFPFRVKKGVGIDGNRAEIKARLDGFFGGRMAQQGIRGARVQYAIPPPPPQGAGAGAPAFAQRPVPPAPQLKLRHGPPAPPAAPALAAPIAPGVVPRAPPLAAIPRPNVAPPRRRRSLSPPANVRGGLLDAIRLRGQERNAAAPAAAPANDEAKQADEPLPPEFQEVAFPPGPWSCMACTYVNEAIVLACEICATPRSHEAGHGAMPPPPPPPAVLGDAAAPPPPPPEVDIGPPSPPPPPPRDEEEQKGPPLLSAFQHARAADDALDRDLSAILRDHAVIAPQPAVPALAPAVAAAVPAAPPMNAGPPVPGLDEPSSLDDLGMLPTALLRGFSDPEDQRAEQEAAARVAAAAKAAEEALRLRREEIEREDRLLESQCEFDGVRHRDLIVELQGSSALLFDVPLAPAPKGNNGMERFPVQMKEPLKSYTLIVDLMLPKGQLHELPDPSLQSVGIKPVPTPPNPNLRYFPFFDVHTVVAVNDPMSFKSFFIHPSGVVGPLNNAVWKEPDPRLLAQEWSRVAVVVDVARDRYEVWIDGLQAVHAMANFKNNAQGDKLKRLEMKNLSEALAKKQLRLFAGQVDVRKQDEAHLKAKRLRRVEVYHRALTAAEIWALSGGGGAASVAAGGTGGNLTNNPLSPYLCALSLKPLPPLVGGSAPIHMGHAAAAVDKRNSRMFFLGGMSGEGKDRTPTSTVYEIDLRKKPMLLAALDKPVAPAKVYARAHSSALFYSGAVWWFGGREVSGEKALNSLVKFTPATNQYELLEFPLTTVPAMAGHAAVLIGAAMYVVGADSNTPAGSAAPSLGVWQYVFASNTWNRVEIVANLKSDGAPATEPAPSSSAIPAVSSSTAASSSASSSSSSASSSQPAPGNRSRKNSGAAASPNAAALASASAAASSSSAAPRPKVRSTSKGVWHPVVGSYGTTIVVFGGSNSLLGKKVKFAGKGIAGEFVLDASTLDGPAPKAAWRNLLSPVAIGRARGPADATRLYAAGGMVALGSELLFYGGMGACVRSTLYAYNTITHKWREVVLPVSQPARVARAYHTTGYDPLTGTIVIAGGQDSGSRALLTADYISVKSVGF